jgi:hypothetical protein
MLHSKPLFIIESRQVAETDVGLLFFSDNMNFDPPALFLPKLKRLIYNSSAVNLL